MLTPIILAIVRHPEAQCRIACFDNAKKTETCSISEHHPHPHLSFSSQLDGPIA